MASIDVLSSGVLLAIFDYLPAANSVAVCLASLAMSKQLAPWKAKVDAAVEEARRNLDVFAEVGLQLPTLLEPTQPSYTFDYHDPHNGLVRLSRRGLRSAGAQVRKLTPLLARHGNHAPRVAKVLQRWTG